MHPTEIPYLTREQYESLSPANRGWFSRVQGSNPNIPHLCPYLDNSVLAAEWRGGWKEADDDLASGEGVLVEYCENRA